MKTSILIPVYNEVATIDEILRRVREVEIDKQIIVVDDGSNDGTVEKLVAQKKAFDDFEIVFHAKNQGKGAALRTAFAQVSGDVIAIQDADLEYQPEDYRALLNVLKKGEADVVYGSRFIEKPKGFSWHYLGNSILTSLGNFFTKLKLTDMETCYKLFRSDLLRKIDIKSNGFDFDPEFTMKAARLGLRFAEVAVSYNSRTYAEGKKITLFDGVKAVVSIFKYRFWD